MSTRDPEDGLRRTRRSLTIASVVLILITVAGIEVTEYSLPWVKGSVERPHVIYLAIWVGLLYWAVAYLQFLRSSEAGQRMRELVRSGTEARLRKKLFAEHAELFAARKKEIAVGDKDDARFRIDFIGDWYAVFTGSPFTYGNKYKTTTHTADWKEFHDIKLRKGTVRWAQIRAFILESIKSPILWDYVPLLLVVGAVVCGFFEYQAFREPS